MTVHLVKMCVGVDSVEDLAAWQARRLAQARKMGEPLVLHHFTRNTPRRAEELLDGGSLYWVIRGFMRARQKLVAIERMPDAEGRPRCALGMEPRLVRIELRAHRPFQGWRYLSMEEAPPDVSLSATDNGDLPEEMAEELKVLGLL
jgi:hypothetical protein